MKTFKATVEVVFTCRDEEMVRSRIITLPFGDKDLGFKIAKIEEGTISPHEDECLLPEYREFHGLRPVVLTPEQREEQGL